VDDEPPFHSLIYLGPISAEEQALRAARRWEKAAFDFDLDVSYEYLAEQVRQAIEDRSAQSARTYLGIYGDAATERVQSAIAEAEDLIRSGHLGSATALAATAVEVTVRELVIRPLVHGAFLSDQWAEVLSDRVIGGRSADDRGLLVLMAKSWDLDLEKVPLRDGGSAWGAFTGSVLPARNLFVHRGDPIDEKVATQAVECATALLNGLMVPLARRFGADWPAKPWHHGQVVDGFSIRTFEPQDPFVRRTT
jgi:hypothetical protein